MLVGFVSWPAAGAGGKKGVTCIFTTPGIEPVTFKKRDKSLKRCATVIRNSHLSYISMIAGDPLIPRPPIGGEPARTRVLSAGLSAAVPGSDARD